MLFYECGEEECLKRILSRNQGRSDDNIEVVRYVNSSLFLFLSS